ncbi:MAG: hypothetical protein KGO53_14000 [Alphaproteobacteria bacterium]|nr:hypothetical protein [Alphaproteobacteria bacterium]
MRRTAILTAITLAALLATQTQSEARGMRRWRFHSHHHAWEYDLAPIKAGRGDYLKVLEACRRKYSGSSDIRAEYSGHYGQHGWFCAYKF